MNAMRNGSKETESESSERDRHKKIVKNTEGNMRSQLAVCEYKSSTFFACL